MKYHVLLKAIVNVRIASVEAENPDGAIDKALQEFHQTIHDYVDTNLSEWNEWASEHDSFDGMPENTLCYLEFSGDYDDCLVDEEGDEQFERSVWIKMED